MNRLGQAVSVLGGVLVLAPVGVALAELTVGSGPSVVLDRAPTVVLTGLCCIAVGIALREVA